jgi:hypothetical protein
MLDLFFDINTRDLRIENGDFAMTTNPSVQNASIIKEARCFSLFGPAYGVGLMESINSPVSVLVYEMQRWEDQVRKDGAVIARFNVTNKDRISNIDIEVSYE